MNLDAATTGLGKETAERIERIFAGVPDPEGALASFTRFRESRPDDFSRIARSATALDYLIHTFAFSRFLANELLQHPQWIEELIDEGGLNRVYLADEYVERLEAFLAARASADALSLAHFRRKETFRIVLRDVLGFAALAEIAEELSNLADAILEVAYRRILNELATRYGRPDPSGFAIIALGKHGGCELNYSSDIDLMFVYSGNGKTDGSNPISDKEFYKKLATQLTALLSTYTAEGLCYRIDLRLRPEGRHGEVCISLSGARAYYERRARDWELQMLIKARVAAGDRETGRELLDFVEPLIYTTTLDFTAVEAMSATRDRIDEKLAARRGTRSAFDVKLARGGIRDIEFLVQCLQRLHGGRVPWVRHGGTLLALLRLQDKNLLSATEYGRLASAYEFLRHLEHRLQMVDDRQTHTLPADGPELDLLARRMPRGLLAEPAREHLLSQLNAHLEQVTTIYERIIHAQKPIYYASTGASEADVPTAEPSSNLIRSLDETAPALASEVAEAGLSRGLRAFEQFLEDASRHPKLIQALESDPALARAVLDLFEHSPYFAEQLVRDPRLVSEVRSVLSRDCAVPHFASETGAVAEPADLRRLYRREMVRTQAASICCHTPIFDTLGRTSDLADAAIAAAYRTAVAQVVATRPPQTPGYNVADQLMVIALGRLGMREFDLASDADLVFVLPDEEHREAVFWTHVAERMIDVLTAYTGEGVVFAVDTRLRPNGRAGALVQTVAAHKEYFAKTAEAWEGIAWMKSRGVAGNMDRADEFLHALQEFDWRRYGQGGRSKKSLIEMRARLEREQGPSNPLKAGRGGYYDIDFVLMYLRLKGAGLFFKVLNTPARVDILEKMGHLEREDAEFLVDAATFYRAVDHALRVFSGQAEGSLPHSESKLAALEELVERWTPAHLHDARLRDKAAEIQEQTRQLFERIFS